MSAAEGGESCCPPGSIGAPPGPAPTFDDQHQPKGTFVTVPDTLMPCYYVAPSSASESASAASYAGNTKAMILFPDVWGFQSRILLIADWLAQHASCHVLVIDFFRGETKDDHADMKAWFEGIPYEPTIARDLASCIDYLQTKHGITDFGAMGFCWGGWAIAKTCQASSLSSATAAVVPSWKVVVSPHPSFKIEPWVFGGDDVQLMQSMTCPVLLMPAGNDPPYTQPDSAEFQAMPNKKSSKSIHFQDMSHGWTTRGDLTDDPKLKRDVDAALQASLDFIQTHL
jgi:dienelactone hydrolase